MWNNNLVLEVIAVLLILSNSITDPLRDVWMKSNEIGWWKRHIAKWGQFYPPLVFITVVHVRWWLWISLVPLSLFLWQWSLIKIAKTDWGGSKWLKWIRFFG